MKSRPKSAPDSIDESAESELTIQPDGRVFAFGITGALAAVLATIPTADDRTRRRLERISHLDARPRPPSPSHPEENE